MSLINQMLQDLESRRAALNGDAGMPNEIRSLPQQRPPALRASFLAGVAAILVTGLGGVWWLADAEKAPVPAAPAIPLKPISQPSALVAPPPPVAVPAAEPQPVPAQEQASPSPPTLPAEERKPPSPASDTPQLKVAAELDVAARAGKPAPVAGKGREGKENAARPVPAPVQQAAAEPTGADDTRIEKKMRMTSARERAENEYRRAIGLVNQGRIQDAMAVLRGVLSEDAGHVGSRLALFGLLLEQQRLDEAQALLAESLQRDPAQPQLASRLARLQLERGDARGARETLDKAAGAAQDNPDFRAFRAAVLQRLTFHREAVSEYQAALRMLPQAGVWWMGLGISLEAEGRLAEAREAYQRAKATGALSVELSAFVEQKLKRLQ